MNRLEYIAEIANYGKITKQSLLKKEVNTLLDELLSKTKPKWISDDYIKFYHTTPTKKSFYETLFFVYKRKHSHIYFNDSHEDEFNLLYTLKCIYLVKKDDVHDLIRPIFKRYLSNIGGVNYCTPDKKIKFNDLSASGELMKIGHR